MFTFESLGINLSYLVTIVLIIEFIKRIDKKAKLKKVYVYLPLIISAIMGVATITPFLWKEFLLSTLTYTGIASYGYDFVKNSLNTLLHKDKQ